MKRLSIMMIAVAVAIIGMGIREFSCQRSEISALAKENIEALTLIPELSEVVITCSSGHDGQCFAPEDRMVMCGEYMYNPCIYMGYPQFSCNHPPCANPIII